MRALCYAAALSSGAAALLAAGLSLGQQTPPAGYRGVQQEVLAAIDLAPELDSVKNRELRLSRAVIAPGGHVGLHSHQGDPSIVYILSGVLTNHHDDGSTAEFRPGQSFAEFGPHAHWIENRGSQPVTFIVANIHRRR